MQAQAQVAVGTAWLDPGEAVHAVIIDFKHAVIIDFKHTVSIDFKHAVILACGL
jgi:hypothetical protein